MLPQLSRQTVFITAGVVISSSLILITAIVAVKVSNKPRDDRRSLEEHNDDLSNNRPALGQQTVGGLVNPPMQIEIRTADEPLKETIVAEQTLPVSSPVTKKKQRSQPREPMSVSPMLPKKPKQVQAGLTPRLNINRSTFGKKPKGLNKVAETEEGSPEAWRHRPETEEEAEGQPQPTHDYSDDEEQSVGTKVRVHPSHDKVTKKTQPEEHSIKSENEDRTGDSQNHEVYKNEEQEENSQNSEDQEQGQKSQEVQEIMKPEETETATIVKTAKPEVISKPIEREASRKPKTSAEPKTPVVAPKSPPPPPPPRGKSKQLTRTEESAEEPKTSETGEKITPEPPQGRLPPPPLPPAIKPKKKITLTSEKTAEASTKPKPQPAATGGFDMKELMERRNQLNKVVEEKKPAVADDSMQSTLKKQFEQFGKKRALVSTKKEEEPSSAADWDDKSEDKQESVDQTLISKTQTLSRRPSVHSPRDQPSIKLNPASPSPTVSTKTEDAAPTPRNLDKVEAEADTDFKIKFENKLNNLRRSLDEHSSAEEAW